MASLKQSDLWAAAAVGAILGGAAAAGKQQTSKTQAIRAIDVLFLGPFMVWLGSGRQVLLPGSRIVLAFTGAATVTYNAVNFLREQRALP